MGFLSFTLRLARFQTPAMPGRATMPNPAKWPRKAHCPLPDQKLADPMKRIIGRATASQITTAPIASFFCRLTVRKTRALAEPRALTSQEPAPSGVLSRVQISADRSAPPRGTTAARSRN